MLGWGRRKDAQAVEAMREQLAAADMHARSVLAAVAQTDSRWSKDREDRARVQLSTEGALERMTAAYADNTADITRSLHHISEMCSLVAEKLEADRMERHELTDAIQELKRLLSSPLETPSQVLGGMVYCSHEPSPMTEIVRNGDARYAEQTRNGANGNGNGVPFTGTATRTATATATATGTARTASRTSKRSSSPITRSPSRRSAPSRRPRARAVRFGRRSSSELSSSPSPRPRHRPSVSAAGTRSRRPAPRLRSRWSRRRPPPWSSSRCTSTTCSPDSRCCSRPRRRAPSGPLSRRRPAVDTCRRASRRRAALSRPPSPRPFPATTASGTTATGSPRRTRFGPRAEPA